MTKPKRVVFATEFWHGATGAGLAHGFRELGWLVEEIDVYHYLKVTDNRLIRGVERLLAGFSMAEYNQAILKSAERNKADVMLTVKGGHITTDTVRALRRMGVRTVNFWPDFEFEHVGFGRDMLTAYNLVVTTKSYHVDYLRGLMGEGRYAFIHHGYSPIPHRLITTPATGKDYERDIIYVGNHSKHKFNWLLNVANEHADKSFLVVGDRWAEAAKGTALEQFVLGYAVTGDLYAELIGTSRINIALHFGTVREAGWEDWVSTRTFEIPACGGFMLHIDNAEVRGLYDVPSEIDTFATPAELNAKIAHYLAHPEERRAIADRGHARAVPAYSLDARARAIAELL